MNPLPDALPMTKHEETEGLMSVANSEEALSKLLNDLCKADRAVYRDEQLSQHFVEAGISGRRRLDRREEARQAIREHFKRLADAAPSDTGEQWLVVAKRELHPPDVHSFDDYDKAAHFFGRTQERWSDVFLCRVLNGPGRPLLGLPAVPQDTKHA